MFTSVSSSGEEESARPISRGSREEKATIDHFEGIRSNLLLLERLDADVTLPLEACRPYAGPLLLRGPVRDISVFRYLINNRGIWEPHVTAWLAEFLQDGGDFVDAGANLGYFSVLAGALLAQTGKVVGLEPIPSHADFCRRNVELNGLVNVEILPYALWDKAELLEMALHGDDSRHLGGAHIVPEDGGGQPTQKVQCLAFDKLVESGEVDLPNLRLIKMDIEGTEPFALDGMTKTLETTRPVLALEMNTYCLGWFGLGPTAIWDRLRALDYRIMALPGEKQHEVLGGLKPPWPATSLREFTAADQLIEVSLVLNEMSPPCFPMDLIAIPEEFGSSSF